MVFNSLREKILIQIRHVKEKAKVKYRRVPFAFLANTVMSWAPLDGQKVPAATVDTEQCPPPPAYIRPGMSQNKRFEQNLRMLP